MAVTAALCVACAPDTGIEPIPWPIVPPDLIWSSALDGPKGWVTVVGAPGALPSALAVVLTNTASGDVDQGEVGLDGAFVLAVPAQLGDLLRVTAEGHLPLDRVAAAPAQGAPGAPGAAGQLPSASPVDAAGHTTVACTAGCVDGTTTVVVINPAWDELTVVAADDGGAFSAPIAAVPGQQIVLFAVRDGEGSPSVAVAVPLGADGDGDGADASIDCDDGDEHRNPGADERCNLLDDDCDGSIDEGCVGVACTLDEDCPTGETCETDLCSSGDHPGDRDGDGVPDGEDLCPNVFETEPGDLDEDGIGDACDADRDGDGFTAPVDCDDSRADRSPSASELCGDGLDNDCDGQTDEMCVSMSCATDVDCHHGMSCRDGLCMAGMDGHAM